MSATEKASTRQVRTRQARTRQAKGSVQEAIGKIIGDPALEKRGSIESKAGARQAEAETKIDKDSKD